MSENIDTEATYVYKGKEVKMTGRTAKKAIRKGKEDILFEVKPVDIAELTSTKYNSWVRENELHRVE